MDIAQLAILLRQQGLPENNENDQQSKFFLALKLADKEYHHPECEAVQAAAEQRSFCFQHDRITQKSILLIHGFTACPYEMRELGETLFQAGHNVFGVRLAGHGTNIRDFSKYNGGDWMQSMRKGLGIAALLGEEVVVIGESMGGSLAVLLASDFPELINKLILCAPCFRTANFFAPLMAWSLIRKMIPQTNMGICLEWQKAYWYERIPTTGVAELIKIIRKARRRARLLVTPVLIVQASDDKIVRPKAAEKFYQGLSRLSEANKQIKQFTPGHHNLTIDLNPGKTQVFQWIIDFIDKER